MYIYLKACCKVKQNNFKARFKTYILYTAFINICLLKYKDLDNSKTADEKYISKPKFVYSHKYNLVTCDYYSTY